MADGPDMAAEYRQLQRSWTARLAERRPVLLDGALGTELERRGVRAGLPLWSTHALLEAPDVVAQVHREYAEAGAEVLTAGTFRTQRRCLRGSGVAGLEARALELTRDAVRLARDAADAAGARCFVAGSAPPLEDCYRPDRVPEDGAAEREHREHAENLADAGVDVIAVETHNCIREARAAARAAAATGLPFWVSFVCGPDARLLSGETLVEAVAQVADFGPALVGVNCLPPSAVGASLAVLERQPIGFLVYANLGAPAGQGRSEPCSPSELALHALAWIRAGARMVGGCCGTGPAHVRAICSALARA
jgi:S-methylmethionine-dependent homocysteine/selenocysteine methylase